MLTNKKLTLINKVLALEIFINDYLQEPDEQPLRYAIERNTKSIKALIKRN